MKFSRFSVKIAVLAVLLLSVSCAREELPDNREQDYGYVQFKVYKDASYVASKAGNDGVIDVLGDASKVRVEFSYGGNSSSLFRQTLTLTAADAEAAEYGLRSEKLKLLAGSYRIEGIKLFDKLDQECSNEVVAASEDFEVVPGGLSLVDLTADVTPRGKVRFRFIKDISDFTDIPTKAVENGQYTFDEIAYVDLTVRRSGSAENISFSQLPVSFSIHFDEDDYESDAFGYQTSSLQCDSVLFLTAGDYRVISYSTYDKNRVLKERNSSPSLSEFSIQDNVITDTDVRITLHEADEYIKDYYALYEIWKALDGENWYFTGESFPKGCNWDFNKSPDLWGQQPGVYLHSNGRVASIDFSDFGFRGHMPAAIGQLTELVEIYLGTHNDLNLLEFDPSIGRASNSAERLENHKEYLHLIHPATQMAEPIARALAENNIKIRETELYDKYTESQLINSKSGHQNTIQPMDMIHGKLCNGLLSLPEEFCNLVNLEKVNIANGMLTELPKNLGNLKSVTDFELYNCSLMKEFPMQIADLPSVQAINISNNAQWTAEEVDRGMAALANGACASEVQIIYARENNLTAITEDFSNFKSLHMLDLSYNQIEEVAPMGDDIMIAELYLDHNRIEKLPQNLCSINNLETFSAQYNKMKLFPDIFTAKSNFDLVSLDFSYNEIEGFENEDSGYKGLNVGTLTLVGNKLEKFPACLMNSGSRISYINMRACGIETIDDGSFTGENSYYLTSIDLSYNRISSLPKEFDAVTFPYLYGVELSYNRFSSFPYGPLNSPGLTVIGIRGQRDAGGGRCLREWPSGIGTHKGMRGLYIGSNDLQKITDSISYLIYYLDISDNPNIVFDASSICYYYRAGVYFLIYDKTQNITGCDYLF